MGGPQVTAQVWALPVLKPSVPTLGTLSQLKSPTLISLAQAAIPPPNVGFQLGPGLERRTVGRSQTHQPQLTPATSFDLGLPCIPVRNAFQSRIAVRKLQSRVRALDIG